MRFAGIDIASENHVVAVVDVEGQVLVKATSFKEDAGGYQRLLELLGPPEGCLVAMEATGHYWQNLFAFLAAEGFQVALLNPLRTHHFAAEDLRRAKTDAIDAVGIARFAQQKRPAVTALPDEATLELREMVRLRDRMMQDLGDRVRQLHRSSYQLQQWGERQLYPGDAGCRRSSRRGPEYNWRTGRRRQPL